jgi:Trk K+ transport system NAD-binding subunit
MWQQALAATILEPIVICGLGRVGYRIAKQLHAAGYPVIGIEATQTPLVETLMDSDMPVIIGDIRNIEVLHDACIPRAKHVLVCTHDDLTNITAANYVREMNAHAELTLRLFDDEIADQLKRAFNIKTSISRSAVAAQAFAYAALGLEVLETFYLHTKTYVLAEISINRQREIPHTLLEFTKDKAMTVVCIYRDKSFIIEPHETTILMENDNLIVFTELENLTQFQSNECLSRAHVIVCGIGHTGYRVALALRALGQTVYAVDYETNSLTERLHAEGIRVILGDYRQMSILEEAGIDEAIALIACSEDDMVNVDTVLKARERIPSIRIIARIFEESLGRRLQHIRTSRARICHCNGQRAPNAIHQFGSRRLLHCQVTC